MSFPAYEWLLIPAVATFLVGTFGSRAAMQRGFQVAPLALLTMTVSLLLTCGAALALAPHGWVSQAGRPGTVWIAVLGGAAGGLGLCCIYAALRQRATGPAATISSMSVLVPIGLGLALGWDAALTPVKAVGALLTLAGTVAINLGKSPRAEGERFHWLWLALASLLLFGVSQAAQKYITVVQPQSGHAPRYAFMAIYYLGGMLTLGLYLARTRQLPQFQAWPYAVCLGLNSLVQFVCMLALLQHVSTALVYITFTGGGIMLVLVASSLVLHERYRMAVWIGCLLGAVGIVLMRL